MAPRNATSSTTTVTVLAPSPPRPAAALRVAAPAPECRRPSRPRPVRARRRSAGDADRARRGIGDHAVDEVERADERGDEAAYAGVVDFGRACRPARCAPSFITTMRSDIDSASSWSWVTKIVVMPSLRCSDADLLAQRNADACVERRQRLVEQQDLRLRRSARASDTRCCWPPES